MAGEVGTDIHHGKRAGLLHDIENPSIMKWKVPIFRLVLTYEKYKESQVVINAVESHHGDTEPTSLVACIVQAADAISAAETWC